MESLIGRTWAPVRYEVGREKVREYAVAIGDDNPIHRDPDLARAQGLPGLLAPPMFCTVYCAPAMAAAVYGSELGIEPGRFLHGAQRFEWSAPVCAGDTISTGCRLEAVYDKGSYRFYEFGSTSTNQRGEVTVSARYTGILRPADGARKTGDDRREGRVSEGESAASSAAMTPLPRFAVTPDRYAPHRYAGASGDFTPIHLDADFARAVGLPGIILHGLYTMALLSRAVVALAAGDPLALRELEAQFRGYGVPERPLTVRGSVRERTDGKTAVEALVEQDGKAILRNGRAVIDSAREP